MEHIIIGILVFGSILGLTLIIERGLALRWRIVIPREVQTAVMTYRSDEDLTRLRQVCRANPSPISGLLLLAEEHRHWPKSENVDALETRARHEVSKLERGLVIMEIIVGSAPLLGLVGTIFGLITLFAGVGDLSAADSGAIARGIAIALNATLMGLITAIPSLIGWSYYNSKVDRMAVEMETLCDEFLKRSYRAGEKRTLPRRKKAAPTSDDPVTR
jgi:biopolymer transport protein ExbB